MSIVHGTFTVERRYPVPRARMFQAFADPSMKRRWSVAGEGWEVEHHALDFRSGGRETARFRPPDRPPIDQHTVWHDVVQNERIVGSSALSVDGRPLSVSLTTTELSDDDEGTRLRVTDQGVYFDDPDAFADREERTRGLLDALETVLVEGSPGDGEAGEAPA
jgi:uncharacterized protein YndB with AHSA1/START domain